MDASGPPNPKKYPVSSSQTPPTFAVPSDRSAVPYRALAARLFSFFKAFIFDSFLWILCLLCCCSVVGVQGVAVAFVASLEARVSQAPAHVPILLSLFNVPPQNGF